MQPPGRVDLMVWAVPPLIAFLPEGLAPPRSLVYEAAFTRGSPPVNQVFTSLVIPLDPRLRAFAGEIDSNWSATVQGAQPR